MLILEPQDLPLFSGPSLSLLVLVISSPGNSAVRETIRSLQGTLDLPVNYSGIILAQTSALHW